MYTYFRYSQYPWVQYRRQPPAHVHMSRPGLRHACTRVSRLIVTCWRVQQDRQRTHWWRQNPVWSCGLLEVVFGESGDDQRPANRLNIFTNRFKVQLYLNYAVKKPEKFTTLLDGHTFDSYCIFVASCCSELWRCLRSDNSGATYDNSCNQLSYGSHSKHRRTASGRSMKDPKYF